MKEGDANVPVEDEGENADSKIGQKTKQSEYAEQRDALKARKER